MTSLLTTLRFADTAFPSGSFGFSNGIEALVSHGKISDARRLTDYLILLLRHRWACADRVALSQSHRGGLDLATVRAVDRVFEASCACEPVRSGSSRNGLAYLTSHARLETPGAREYRDMVLKSEAVGHLSVVQGMTLRALGVEEITAIEMSLYTTAANMAQAAVRLGQIGALDAQRSLGEALANCSDCARIPEPESEICSFVPYSEIVTVQQSRTNVRLFAN